MRRVALIGIIALLVWLAALTNTQAAENVQATGEATITATSGTTLTATASPTWVATPQGALGPFNFPANVNPLTGSVVDDPSVLQRRPLAVKISNAPALVRPQAGIGEADVRFD